jgi:hypothetical protein
MQQALSFVVQSRKISRRTVYKTYQCVFAGHLGIVRARYNIAMKAISLAWRSRTMVPLTVIVIFWTMPCAGVTRAPGEKVISFVADITVREDMSIEVREEFVVHSEESYFKWGMIRHLPISSNERWDKRFGGEWKDDTGIRVRILEVTEDGNPVSCEKGGGAGYAQLRIGKSDVPLARGDHTFVIKYLAEGVPRSLADHDELYWNVLGHYLGLPVDEVKVHVHLPAVVPMEESNRMLTWEGGA